MVFNLNLFFDEKEMNNAQSKQVLKQGFLYTATQDGSLETAIEDKKGVLTPQELIDLGIRFSTENQNLLGHGFAAHDQALTKTQQCGLGIRIGGNILFGATVLLLLFKYLVKFNVIPGDVQRTDNVTSTSDIMEYAQDGILVFGVIAATLGRSLYNCCGPSAAEQNSRY
jgi:hypothetical protein